MSELRFQGRREPYTTSGVARRPCTRCGRRASFQWSACANGNRFLPLCVECDIALNRLALSFMRVKGWRRLVAAYARAKRDATWAQ